MDKWLDEADGNKNQADFAAYLGVPPQAQVRRVLAGFVSKIIVDREGINVIGQVFYFSLDKSMSTAICPQSDSGCRYTFSAFFTGQIRAWHRHS